MRGHPGRYRLAIELHPNSKTWLGGSKSYTGGNRCQRVPEAPDLANIASGMRLTQAQVAWTFSRTSPTNALKLILQTFLPKILLQFKSVCVSECRDLLPACRRSIRGQTGATVPSPRSLGSCRSTIRNLERYSKPPLLSLP
jgi:hypothetical protein